VGDQLKQEIPEVKIRHCQCELRVRFGKVNKRFTNCSSSSPGLDWKKEYRRSSWG
jgi:hypothetical protein